MAILLTALTALMSFATPVVAGDWGDAEAANKAGDYKKEFRLLKGLAEQGDADAQFNLSICYHEGQGVEKDLEEANYWYTKAIEQDNVAASNIVKYFEDQKNVLNFDYWKKKSRK